MITLEKIERLKGKSDISYWILDISKGRGRWALPTAKRTNHASETKKPRAVARGFVVIKSLAVSYSHMGTPTLPSALKRFTAEFGMDQVVPLRYGRQA